jgi:hypothetical protein
MRSVVRWPAIQGVGLFLVVAGAIGLCDQCETVPLIKPAGAFVALERPQAQARESMLRNGEQRGADAGQVAKMRSVKNHRSSSGV